jgi:hypothetical protein
MACTEKGKCNMERGREKQVWRWQERRSRGDEQVRGRTPKERAVA